MWILTALLRVTLHSEHKSLPCEWTWMQFHWWMLKITWKSSTFSKENWYMHIKLFESAAQHGLIQVRQEYQVDKAWKEATSFEVLRGVKDWVHMKTAKMMKDFNWLCNLDVNHKLFLTFIIKVVYLCTLHNKIISPAHFVVYVLWRPTPTSFSNINA